MDEKITITTEEANLVRQWFDAVQDLNQGYLTQPDYELAQRLYQALGRRVPSSISTNVKR